MVTLQVCYAFFLMLGAVGEPLRMQTCLRPDQSRLSGHQGRGLPSARPVIASLCMQAGVRR